MKFRETRDFTPYMTTWKGRKKGFSVEITQNRHPLTQNSGSFYFTAEWKNEGKEEAYNSLWDRAQGYSTLEEAQAAAEAWVDAKALQEKVAKTKEVVESNETRLQALETALDALEKRGKQ